MTNLVWTEKVSGPYEQVNSMERCYDDNNCY